MKRRTFVNVVGSVSAGLVITPSIASSVFGDETNRSFSDEELKAALEKYCRKIFNSSPELETLVPNGRYSFADSFEIEINTKLNSIFDFADEVIEKAKSTGFDASALKEGNIPDGMQVASGGVIFQNEGKMAIFKVEGLKNYNATITYKNGINIATKVPPCEWKKLKKIEKAGEKAGGYLGNLNGPFRIWIMNDRSINMNVEEIEPAIRFDKDMRPLNTVNDDFLNGVFSEEILEIISSDRT